jgi:hypothetical protein
VGPSISTRGGLALWRHLLQGCSTANLELTLVIEGYLSRVNRSGRVAGRSELAMKFERIRLRGGSTQEFDGYIESVRTSNGEEVRVDSEGIVSEQDSQSTRTTARTG